MSTDDSQQPLGVPLDVDVVFRLVTIDDVRYDFSMNTAFVLLRETEGEGRSFALPVALTDAGALYNAWHLHVGRRPATSELMAAVLQELQSDIVAVRIVRYEAGIFFAELDLMTHRGRRVFDCRPSDALSLALRQPGGAPLLVDVTVVDAVLADGPLSRS